jgi:ankyrin repeat protein
MEMDASRAAELLSAAQRGDVAALGKLLPVAGDLTTFVGQDGVTPLMLAAAGGHEPAVKLLLERGSSPARRDVEGRSAAAYARAAGHPHLAAQLDSIVDQEETLW